MIRMMSSPSSDPVADLLLHHGQSAIDPPNWQAPMQNVTNQPHSLNTRERDTAVPN
jgi:hypothetical protein